MSWRINIGGKISPTAVWIRGTNARLKGLWEGLWD